MNIVNYKLNLNDVVVANPINGDTIIDLMSICNTGADMTLSIYKKSNAPFMTYYIIDAITLKANSTFVYQILRLQKNWTLHVQSPDGTADISLSMQNLVNS